MNAPITALPANPAEEMTKEQMQERISLLANEIDANEEENRVMQNEINSLCNRIDEGAHK